MTAILTVIYTYNVDGSKGPKPSAKVGRVAVRQPGDLMLFLRDGTIQTCTYLVRSKGLTDD